MPVFTLLHAISKYFGGGVLENLHVDWVERRTIPCLGVWWAWLWWPPAIVQMETVPLLLGA